MAQAPGACLGAGRDSRIPRQRISGDQGTSIFGGVGSEAPCFSGWVGINSLCVTGRNPSPGLAASSPRARPWTRPSPSWRMRYAWVTTWLAGWAT